MMADTINRVVAVVQKPGSSACSAGVRSDADLAFNPDQLIRAVLREAQSQQR